MLWAGVVERDGHLGKHIGAAELEGLLERGDRWAAVGSRDLSSNNRPSRSGKEAAPVQLNRPQMIEPHSSMIGSPQMGDGLGMTGYSNQSIPAPRAMEMQLPTPTRHYSTERPYSRQPPPHPVGAHASFHTGPEKLHNQSFAEESPQLAPLNQSSSHPYYVPTLPPIQLPPPPAPPPRQDNNAVPHSTTQTVSPNIHGQPSPSRISQPQRSYTTAAEAAAALGGARELVRLASTEEAQPSSFATTTETGQLDASPELVPGTTSACDVLAIAAAAVAEQKRSNSTEVVAAGERQPTPVLDPIELEPTFEGSVKSRLMGYESIPLPLASAAGSLTEVSHEGGHPISVARSSGRSPGPTTLPGAIPAPPVLNRINTDVKLSATPKADTVDTSRMMGTARPDSRSAPAVELGGVAPVARKIKALPHAEGKYAGVVPMQGNGRPSPILARGYDEGYRGAREWYGDWHAPGPVGRAPPMQDYYYRADPQWQAQHPGWARRPPHSQAQGFMSRPGPGPGTYTSPQIAEKIYKRSLGVGPGPGPPSGPYPQSYDPPVSQPIMSGYGQPTSSAATGYYHQQAYSNHSYDGLPPTSPHLSQYGSVPPRRMPMPMAHSQGMHGGGPPLQYDGGAYGLPGLMGLQPMVPHARGISEEQRSGSMSEVRAAQVGYGYDPGYGGQHQGAFQEASPQGPLAVPPAGFMRVEAATYSGGGGTGSSGEQPDGMYGGEGGGGFGAEEGEARREEQDKDGGGIGMGAGNRVVTT